MLEVCAEEFYYISFQNERDCLTQPKVYVYIKLQHYAISRKKRERERKKWKKYIYIYLTKLRSRNFLVKVIRGSEARNTAHNLD